MKLLVKTIALSLAMIGNAAIAQEVSVDVAKNHALDFLTNKSVSSKRVKGENAANALSLAYTSKTGKKTCFYVFNIGEDDGFVIAGGDASAREILGYCDHGSFDWDSAPENFKWWLGQYTKQIENAEVADGAAVRAPQRSKAASARTEIEPLIKTKWNQGTPFNNAIPKYNDNTVFVTGCVATGMAQVMYYHRCPATTGTGSHSYNPETYNSMTFSADFGNTTYDWDNMLLKYTSGNYTTAQANAVATLMYHAGVSVDMDYNTSASGGSGASSMYIGLALATYFKYDKSVRNEFRTYFTDEAWEDLVYNELAAGRPVLYSGQATDGGHQFICDGYDSDEVMFTFNWGWGGYCDGSYPLTGTGALQPNGSGIGGAGSGSSYDQDQQITVNVMPDKGHAVSAHMAQPTGINMFLKIGGTKYEDNYDYTAGTSTTGYLYAGLMNLSCLTTSLDYGVMAKETTTGITYYWSSYSDMSLECGSYYTSAIGLDFALNQLEYNGIYEIRPVCRKTGQTDADWTEVDLLTTETIPTITVSGGTNPEPVDISFEVESNSVQVGRTLQISHNSNYKGAVTYTSSNSKIATVDENGLIKGVKEGNVTITAKGEAEAYYNATTTTFDITVTALVKEDVAFKISDTSVKVDGTLQISWNEDYTGTVSFKSSDTEVLKVDANGTVTGIAEGSATITATATGNTLYNATTKTFDIAVVGAAVVMTAVPYFNNDNNTYEDDIVMYYKIKNTSGSESDAIIYFEWEVDNGYIFSGSFGYLSVPNDYEISGEKDFKTLGSYNMLDYLTENKTYTIYFYTDDTHSEAFNYPSLTFTHRPKMTLDYSIGTTGYGTLILPFDYELPEGMKIYSSAEVVNNVMTLKEETSIERNKPYIVSATSGTSCSFAGPEAVDAESPSFTEGVLVGAVADNVTLTKNTDYILQNQNGKAAFFKYTGTPSDVASENDSSGNRLASKFHAFLRMKDSNSTTVYLPGQPEDGTVGVEEVDTETVRPAGIYSIDGKRQTELQKGLNVILLENGTVQKIFVK